MNFALTLDYTLAEEWLAPFVAGLRSGQAVADCAVVGKPDADRRSIVKAFVKLRTGFRRSDALKVALADHVRSRLAAYKAPRDVQLVDRFEMTSSGKNNRRTLRDAELRTNGTSLSGPDGAAADMGRTQ